MTNVLPSKFEVRPIEFSSTTWHIDLDKVATPIAFTDLLEPGFWQHHSGGAKIKRGDLIRVVGQAASFDVMLVVVGAFAGGLAVETWPRYPNGAAR